VRSTAIFEIFFQTLTRKVSQYVRNREEHSRMTSYNYTSKSSDTPNYLFLGLAW